LRNTKLSVVAAALLLVVAPAAYADVIVFDTPLGATAGGLPVDATATFTTGAGFVDITLTNLESDPKSVAQLLSDLDFVLSNGATTGTLASSSGQQVTVKSDGTLSLGSTGSTGWGLNNNVAGGLQLDALGFIGPAGLIIGAPGSGGTYDNANNSIAGNGPHNPFINQSASFIVDVAGVTAGTTITSATFSFGTTAGSNVPGTVPEPSSLLSLAGMLGGAALVLRKRLGGIFSR
jgi:hypothetical protein